MLGELGSEREAWRRLYKFIILGEFEFMRIPPTKYVGTAPAHWAVTKVRNGRKGCCRLFSLKPTNSVFPTHLRSETDAVLPILSHLQSEDNKATIRHVWANIRRVQTPS